MKYNINKNEKKPAYMQLYYQLRHDIETGAYIYGQKLPSKRTLTEEIGRSIVTVEHAYALLCDEGYVEAKERSGYTVIYKEADFVSHTPDREEEYAPVLHKPQHPFGACFPFSSMSKIMRRVLLDYGEAVFEKPDKKGCVTFRQAICKYLSRSIGIEVSTEQIVIGAGAEYLYGLVAQLLGKKMGFALENPSYEKIKNVYEAHGVACEMLDLGSRGIKTEALQSSQARVLHVTPFNSYPSHITADASKRREYLKWAMERKGYLIEDNYESELTVSKKNEETLFSLSKENCVIYLNTFSRTISPSLRIGYMVLPVDLLDAYEEKLGFYSCTVSVFEQYVLSELINSGEFERNINRIRRKKRKIWQETGHIE